MNRAPFPIQFAMSLMVSLFAWSHSLYAQTPASRELWLYVPANLLVDAEIERLDQLMTRARPLGYDHVLLADSKFSRLKEMDDHYFKNVVKLQQRAQTLDMKLVPAIFPVGYSNDLLSQDPNFAEALPARNVEFDVQNNKAQVVSPEDLQLPGILDRKKWGFIDESLQEFEGGLRSAAPHSPNIRIMSPVSLQPFHQYHVSVQFKTKELNAKLEIKLLTKEGRSLNYTSIPQQPTQDWTTAHITFNSLDNADVNLYIGAWGPTQGELQLKAPKLEECGAVNLVRRPGTPIRVRWKQGTKESELLEGIDFKRWHDPFMGSQPWRGEYDAWHEAPPIELIRPIPNNSKLLVSYYHTHVVHDGQVSGAIGEPEFEAMLLGQAARMLKLFPNCDWMMSHDEYRVMGWDETNASVKQPPSKTLSDNAKKCYHTLIAGSPKSRVFTWSDMFDPKHNAVNHYYLVRGDLTGASAPLEVNIVNWNFDQREESLHHFAHRGHHQLIAGYYDDGDRQVLPWLDTVQSKKIPNVHGIMYTTWSQNYSEIESFAKAVQSHPWWISGK